MNRIPPLVLEEARKIKDLPFERMFIFNHACTEILGTCDGSESGIRIPHQLKAQLRGNITLHNHPIIATSYGMITTAVPSIGDILGARWFEIPRIYICDRNKITETTIPKNISENKINTLRWHDFMLEFIDPQASIEGTIDLLSTFGADFRLLDINTLEPRSDVITKG